MAKIDWNLNAGLKKYSPSKGTEMKKQLILYRLTAKLQHQDLSICLHNLPLLHKKPTKNNQISKKQSQIKTSRQSNKLKYLTLVWKIVCGPDLLPQTLMSFEVKSCDKSFQH